MGAFRRKGGMHLFLPGYGKKLPWERAIFCRSQAILVMWASVIRNKSLLLKSLKRRNAFLFHTTPHYTFSFAFITNAVHSRFSISSVVWCSVSVVSDGVLHYCKSLYIMLLYGFCVVWSRNGRVEPDGIETKGLKWKGETRKDRNERDRNKKRVTSKTCNSFCASRWAWTNDPLINSQVL